MAAAMLGTTLLAGCGGGGGGDAPAPGAPVGTTPGTGTAPGAGTGTTPGTGATPGTGTGTGTGTTPGTGTATPPVTPGGGWLTLTPATASLVAFEGESTPFRITGVSSRTFDKPFNMAVIDSKGVIAPDMTVNAVSQLEYAAELRTAAGLAAGSHTSYLEVRLCEDAASTCSKPLPGSPWFVPVTVNVTPARQRLTLPASIELTVYEGEPAAFNLDAKANWSLPALANLFVVDDSGTLAQNALMAATGPDQYRAQLNTSSVLTPGQYSPELEVRACYDEPRICSKPVTGSPWRVPLKLTVRSGLNLTALSVLPGVAPWSTYNGNAAHTGYVPASFDPANFTRRWNRPERGVTTAHGPAIDNGRVFLITGARFGQWEVVAVNEATGDVAWRYDMGSLHRVNAPAAANGKVYVTSTGHQDSFFWVFDQATGQLVSKTALDSQWPNYQAPTVAGNMVYSNNGYYGGMVKFNSTTNLVEWRNTTLPQVDNWTPSIDANYAYAYLSNAVYAVDLATGNIAFSIANPGSSGYANAPAVVLDGKLGFVVQYGRMFGFDLQARAKIWETNGNIAGHPVLANGIVYSLGENGSQVDARATATGMLQWKSAPLGNASMNVVNERLLVTSNLVFASSSQATVAVDIATRQVVWTYPLGGELAISDRGVLYIVSAGGKVAAINLR